MPQINPLPTSTADERDGRLIPMFVCAGCRPEPVGYTSIEFGDQLDEMVACPMREICTWHAAHDLGGSCSYNEQPEGAKLEPMFKTEPYFSCPNFHDHWTFLTAKKPTPLPIRVEHGPCVAACAPFHASVGPTSA